MRMAHLSDLHFGKHDEALAATLAPELLAQELDVVVISGDFTQRGTEEEFQVARKFIDSLNTRVFAVPGNHDVPQANFLRRMIAPYAHYRKYIDPDLEPFLEVGGVALAGIRTSRRFSLDLNLSNGFIDKGQLRALERRLSEGSPDAVRVVVAHHPLLYPETGEPKRQRRVRRADRALQSFSQLGIRLVLSGHFHLSYVRKHEQPGTVTEGAPDGLRRATAAPILIAQTSSTTSTRLRGHPNAYNLIKIEGTEIEIDVREWRDGRWITKERTQEVAPAT
ncbi:MAG TPA: metallophosphoesterase [Devosia sp.]|jgi:3',5'-cyclic AMP phosphodiesterase CpdA|nr:metallophosphoesterase [Devosia sp.]